ncbi:MAG: hypothetical protein JWM53_5935 [bacterium]|nr:hypothetical protein [bacterium]
MKPLAITVALALAGVVAIGLVGGDPRGTHSMERSEWIVVAGLLLCACTTIITWRTTRAPAWWLVPTGIVAVMGALSGWIAGVEFAGDTQVAARLASAPGKVAFLVAMTTAGLALPSAAVAAIARRFSR